MDSLKLILVSIISVFYSVVFVYQFLPPVLIADLSSARTGAMILDFASSASGG